MKVIQTKCDKCGKIVDKFVPFCKPNGREADPSGNGYEQSYKQYDICYDCLINFVINFVINTPNIKVN